MVVFKMKPKTSQKTAFGVHRVSPAQAKRWREEMDHGIPATEIAEREDCDPRTVLKHVARARRARGSSSAREELLRDALRAHQDDLAAVAKSLAMQFRRGFPPNPASSPDGLPTSALAEHLGKTPSGKALGRWSALADQYPILEKELLRRTKQELEDRCTCRQRGIPVQPPSAGSAPGGGHAVGFDEQRCVWGFGRRCTQRREHCDSSRFQGMGRVQERPELLRRGRRTCPWVSRAVGCAPTPSVYHRFLPILSRCGGGLMTGHIV